MLLSHTSYYAKFEQLPNGDLKMSLTDKFTQYERAEYTKKSIDDAIYDLMEECSGTGGAWGNNWHYMTDTDKANMGHLTESPMIAYNCDFDDNGTVINYDKVWYSPNYMIDNEIEVLFEKHYFIFKLL